MEVEMEEMPFLARDTKDGESECGGGRGSEDWKDVWYRLEDGRGRIRLDGLEQRIRRTTNNAQAIPQAMALLHQADYGRDGYVNYKDFRHFYTTQLQEGSWQRAVLMRTALDVIVTLPSQDEMVWLDVWMRLVDYVRLRPSIVDFNWLLHLPKTYNRLRLPTYTYYRSELIHPSRIKEWVLCTKDAEILPNPLVIQLLLKAESIKQADTNRDGYVEFEEFFRFATTASTRARASAVLTRGALAVLPRTERTLEARQYLEEYTCCPPPLFMPIVSLLEVAAFIYYAVDMGVPIGASGPCPTYSPLVYHPQKRYEAWRYVTYGLIHSGWVHLVNNLIVQVFFGILLELVHRSWRVLLVYMAGVAAGSIAHSMFTPTAYLAGASGGVYAVEYAHLGNLLMNWAEMTAPWVQLVAMVLMIGVDLGFAFWDTYMAAQPSNTGHMAHFGGAIAGVLVGVLVLRNFRVEKWEKYCWWSCLVLFLMLLLTGVLLNVFLPVPEFFPENVF